MTKIQLFVTVGIVAAIVTGAYFLTIERGDIQDEFIDRGNRHEVAEQNKIFETKIYEKGEITVSVRPLTLSPSASEWEFEVTLDTHSIELNNDMKNSSFLVDNEGNIYQAANWEGDPPGGHHRSGVLKFQPLPSSKVIQLMIRGIGGVEKQIFEWRIK